MNVAARRGPRRREWYRGRRRPELLLALVGIASWSVGTSIDAVRADAPVAETIGLEGAGDSESLAEMTGWQNAMYGADGPVDISYYNRGSAEGRALLLRGEADFAFTGVPFTAAELASRPAGAGKLIEVPIVVTSLSIMMSTPTNQGWGTQRLRTEDPLCADPYADDFDAELCIEYGTFTGPLKIPAENLSALVLDLGLSYNDNRLAAWSNPAWASALGTSTLKIQIARYNHHRFTARTDASAPNKYLLDYVRALGPQAYALRKAENPEFNWDAATETVSPRTLSRYGAETQMGVMAINQDPSASVGVADWTGNGGGVATTYVSRFVDLNPNMKYRTALIQNRHGDFLEPTPAAVQAALDASTEPNYAATHDVPGAYPLVWITNLYVVQGSLTPDQANAMAATIRYLVTDGQAAVVEHGGVELPDELVARALAAANEIVVGNCTADGYQVTTGGPGVREPDTTELQQLTGLKHCELAPPPSTTTTTTTIASTTTSSVPEPTSTTSSTTSSTTTSSSTSTSTSVEVASQTPIVTSPPVAYVPPYVPTASGSSGISVSDDATTTSSSTTTSVPGDPTTTVAAASADATTTTAAPSGGGGTRPRGRALSALPLPLPGDGSDGFKKLGTLLLGAALFIYGRRLVNSRRRLSL